MGLRQLLLGGGGGGVGFAVEDIPLALSPNVNNIILWICSLLFLHLFYVYVHKDLATILMVYVDKARRLFKGSSFAILMV